MKKHNAPEYLRMLAGGTQYRMTRLKDRAAQYNSGLHKGPRPSVDGAPTTWRDVRRYGFHNWAAAHCAMSQGFNTENAGTQWEKKTPVWYCHTGEQFRNERDAHTVEDVRMNHTGWYADEDCTDMIIGIVASLTHGRFIAGYRMTCNDERVYFGEVFDNARDAANAGGSAAETLADSEREYDLRWNEARVLANDITEKLNDIKRLYALRNMAGFEDCRDECREEIEAVRTMRSKMECDYSDVEI